MVKVLWNYLVIGFGDRYKMEDFKLIATNVIKRFIKEAPDFAKGLGENNNKK